MRGWIERNVDPPGMGKPRRGALYSAIGRVLGIVRRDAQAAFDARWPYLCDEASLLRHGRALEVPRLPGDTTEEYRERVAAASFYHMRRGERGYVTAQLAAHFGDRLLLEEEFLRLRAKVADMSPADAEWLVGFLDGVVNPAVALEAVEWFHVVDGMEAAESVAVAAHRPDVDAWPQGLCYDGRFLCDQGVESLCDGRVACDGSWLCERFKAQRGTVSDTAKASVFPDGSMHCDGSFAASGYVDCWLPAAVAGPATPVDACADSCASRIGIDALEELARITTACDGTWLCDGGNQQSAVDAPMPVRVVRPLRCDGTRAPSCSSCDGSWLCDGAYQGYDGWYCSGDVIREEVLQ